jgi:mRNA interferase RelE/StbE
MLPGPQRWSIDVVTAEDRSPATVPGYGTGGTRLGGRERRGARCAAYTVIFSRQARRNLYENLSLDVAVAAMETIDGPLTTNPHRAGKPSLEEPFDGYHSARRGTYRIIYRINEDKHTAEIHSIRHRRDAYRT